MALTMAQMATRVMRNIQITEDSNAPNVTALADAKQYLNEGHHKIWGLRVWRESLILGTCSVAASTRNVALSSITAASGFGATNGRAATFAEVLGVRKGTTPLRAEDPSIINALDANLWTRTAAPDTFWSRGASGFVLNGEYSEATTLSILGKADSTDILDNGSETWLLDAEGGALIEYATACMIRDHDEDDERAMIRFQNYSAEVSSLIEAQTVQGANTIRVVPLNPWTGLASEVQFSSSTVYGPPIY